MQVAILLIVFLLFFFVLSVYYYACLFFSRLCSLCVDRHHSEEKRKTQVVRTIWHSASPQSFKSCRGAACAEVRALLLFFPVFVKSMSVFGEREAKKGQGDGKRSWYFYFGDGKRSICSHVQE
jgi:hypothetical protein